VNRGAVKWYKKVKWKLKYSNIKYHTYHNVKYKTQMWVIKVSW